MSGGRWHDDVPARADDPAVRRALRHRALIALMRLATRGRSYEFLRVIAVNRRLLRPFLAFNARLMPRGKLPRADTEVVILRTAWRCGSRYEWVQHEALARRAGVGAAQIAAAGAASGGGEPDEPTRLLIAATDELLDEHMLSEATFRALRERYGPELVFELTMLVGNYAMLAGALNSFGARLESVWR